MKPIFSAPDYEKQRLSALRSYDILDTETEQDFDDITDLASLICEVPIALISLVDSDRLWFKSHKGLEATQSFRAESFCEHAILKPNEVLVVPDAHKDERFKNNPLVTGWLNLTFYAGVPLVNDDGYPLGSLCVADNKRKFLTVAQTEAMQKLARQVMDRMELRRKNKQLTEANRQLEEAKTTNEQLHRQVFNSESKFRSLVKQSPVAMATLLGADYTIELFNDRMLELWGRTAGEVAGMPLFAAIPELSDTGYARLLRKVFSDGKGTLLRETPLTLMQDGKPQTVWLDVIYEPLRDDIGNVAGIIVLNVDITERLLVKKKAQRLQDDLQRLHRETKEREQNLRIAIEAANLNTWTLDFATGEINASNTLKELYGFLPHETVQLDQVLQLVEPSFLPDVQSALADIQRGEERPVEYPIRDRETGERKWMRSMGKAEWDTNGHAVRLIGMNADITERKEYELKTERLNGELSLANNELRKAFDELRYANNRLKQQSAELAASHGLLKESEENLRLAVDAANLGMWMLNLETNEYTVSKTFKGLYGFPPDAVVTVADVTAAVDRRYVTILQNTIRKCIEEKGNINSQFLIHRQDTGEARWIRKFGKVLTDESGKPTLFIGMNADITERRENEQKIRNLNEELMAINAQMQSVNDDLHSANEELMQSEEKLRLVIDSARLGTWFIDLDTWEFIPSPRLKELFGYYPEETMPYEAAINQIREDYRSKVENAVEAAIAQTGTYDIEYPIVGYHDKKLRWVRASGRIYDGKEGESANFFGTIDDITERKLEEQRKSYFMSIVSHKMKTPLTVISGYLDIIRLSASGDETTPADIAQIALVQVRKLTDVINEFLEAGGTESGSPDKEKGI